MQSVVGGGYSPRDVWPRTSGDLPPGQRRVAAMPRFGMRPGLVPPRSPALPTLTVSGEVAGRITLNTDDLSELARVEQHSDFHCVTTWSATDLIWAGWRFAEVYERIIRPMANPASAVTHVRAIADDRYSSALPLEDALADDVVIADRLNGEPLGPFHGGPLRLVAPAHYGYKSVKHLAAITLHSQPPRASGGAMQHPRGRVAHEERHGFIPGRFLRWPYRALVVPVAMRAKRAAE